MLIVRLLAKAHAYAFHVLRDAFETVSDDGLQEWKALVVISVGMGFAGVAIASVASIILQHRVLLPDAKGSFIMLWGTVGAGVAVFNYCTLISGRKWCRFEREFQKESKAARFWGGAAVWVGLILVLAATEWTASVAWKLPPW